MSAFEISEMQKYVLQGEILIGEEMGKKDRSGLAVLVAWDAVADSSDVFSEHAIPLACSPWEIPL